ncbi:hypothetical protein MLS9_02080 [Helicobacter pylori]
MTKLLDLKNNSVIAINQNNYTKEDNYKKVCYLDTDNITNNRINAFLKIDLTKEKLPSRAKRKCSLNSIIYSSVRPNQRHFGIIKEIPKNFLVSTAFIVIDIIDLEKLDPNYLYYYITQDKITHYLQRIAECGTSSYPSITPLDFLNIKIKLYPLETQQKIARTLSILDQKIENNHKINELLHTLAYKIYEFYFKYKPKNAKLEQIIIENPKSSIMVKDAQKTQDKYPFFTSGDNILSYPKAIIDGRNCFLNTGGNAGIKFYVGKASYSTDTWCICAIENNHKINELLHTLAYKIYEFYFKYKPKNAKLEQIIIENPKSSIMVKDAQKTQDKYPFFTSGDNILSYPKAIIDGRNCFLNTGGNAGIKFYVGKASYSTDTWCICANEFSDYLYLLLSNIRTHINQSFFQGTSLKHLQKNLLKKYPIYMPSAHEIKKFNQIITPLLTLISINTRTSKKLEQIRDFLLPLLLKQQVKPQ